MYRSKIINRFYPWLQVILALLCVFPALAMGRPTEPQPPTAKPEPRTFAVSGFPVIGARSTDYSWLGVGLGDDLATRLARCDQHLFQVERLQFNEVLRAQRVEMLTQGVSEAAEPDAAERERLMGLAQATRTSYQGQKWGARYVIVGSLWLEGSYPQDQARLKANVRLVEVATGQIISGAQATSEGTETGYLRLQEQLAEQLAERLGVPVEQRVRVRDYRLEGGEVYRRFAQAREALYQGRYQEAKTLSEQAEAAGAHQLLPQIWETNRQAHERLIQGISEKDKAYQLNRERRQQVEARKREVQELAALTQFEDGEQYRIEAETFERFGDSPAAKEGYQRALTAYDEYLRNTQSGLVRWEVGGIGDIRDLIIADNRIYTVSLDSSATLSFQDYSSHRLRAFDAQTGVLHWDFQVERKSHTPVVVDGIAYTGTNDGHLRAFDAKTGAVHWDFKAKDNIGTPVVVNEIVYVASDKGHLWAFDAKTGAVHWDFKADSSFETPVVVDGIVYVSSWDHHLRAFDAKTGAVHWDFKVKAGLRIQTLVVVDEIVYAGFEDGRSMDSRLCAFDAKTGTLRWNVEAGKGIGIAGIYGLIVVVVDGIAYVGSYDGHLRAFDAKTGDLRWDFKVKAGLRIQTLVVVDGIAYAISDDDHLRAFDAKTGDLRWDFKVKAGLLIQTLEVVDGIAYTRSNDGHLRAFDAKTGEGQWDIEADSFIIASDLLYITRKDRLLAIDRLIVQQTIPTVHQAIVQKAVVLAKLGHPTYAMRVLSRKWRETEQSSTNNEQLLATLLPQSRLSLPIQEALRLRILGKSQVLLDIHREAFRLIVDGIAYAISDDDHLRAFDAKTGDLRWDFKAGDSIDTPVVVDGIAYAASKDKHLRAFDAKTGTVHWDFKAGDRIQTPVLVDGIAYAGSQEGHLRAFDAKTGAVRWHKVGHWLNAALFKCCLIHSPVVVDGIAYAASEDKHLRAFDAKTGAVRWDFKAGDKIETPVVIDGIVYAVSGIEHLWALDAKTGSVRWDFKASLSIETPVVVDGIVYVGSGDGHLWAFDAKTGAVRWDFKAGDNIQIPVVVDGVVYASSWDGHLRAFDAKTGAVHWDFQARFPILRPIVVDGIVYAGSEGGHLWAFGAKTGELCGHVNVVSKGPLFIGAVVDGIIYASVGWNGDRLAFSVAQITSGLYTPDIVWASDEQFYSYLIWGKPGLAARKIVEGYDLEAVLKQSALNREELAAGLDQLAAGIPYHSVGALAEDPGKLRPPWFTVATQRAGQSMRPAVALYLQAAQDSSPAVTRYLQAAQGTKDRAAYLAEAKRLAPDVDLTPWGLK